MNERDDAQFDTSDILILLAVLEGTYSGGTDVRGIISFVDYADHNVLSEDELVGGLRRLAARGFVIAGDGLFRASLRVAREYRGQAEGVKPNSRKFDIVKAIMEEYRDHGALGDHGSSDEVVSAGEYHHALKDYLSGK